MLQLIRCITELDFARLMEIYAQSNSDHGRTHCPNGTSWEQLRLGEEYLRESVSCFLRGKDTMLALWLQEDSPVTALRLEPYRDGLLLSCLETAPKARGKGCATRLLQQVLSLFDCPIYSHIHKSNRPSLAVHRKAGFRIVAEHATLLDGTVTQAYFTLSSQ